LVESTEKERNPGRALGGPGDMVILDTDHITLVERSDSQLGAKLRTRLERIPAQDLMLTIISFEEQTRGWLAQIAKARALTQQVVAYQRLRRHLEIYRYAIILDFDDAAAVTFQRLRSQRIRIGSFDLKIAAIAIAHDATLLSRNLADFRKVPGLKVEDWTMQYQ
jgi:tRNA(fMet)-specific endonuclease VapC